MDGNGWVKIYRKMLEWEWIDDPYTVTLWLRLLLTADRQGQLHTSIRQLSDSLGWSFHTILKILRNLEKSGEIKVETSNIGTTITVLKFNKYQSKGVARNETQVLHEMQQGVAPNATECCTQCNASVAPSATQTQNTPINNKQEYIQEYDKNGGILEAPATAPLGFNTFGNFNNVFLKAQEYRTLVEQNGEALINDMIEDLSCKLADGTIESGNHYSTLLYWCRYRSRQDAHTQQKSRFQQIDDVAAQVKKQMGL